MTRVNESLAELAYRFRSGAKLSQEALAERAGLSTRTISDLETGFSKTPRLVTILLIADALSLGDADRARFREAARKPPARERAAPEGAMLALPPSRALVGRNADAIAAADLLAAPEVRLVTLYGAAGVGKTSLAIHLAWDRRQAFEDGAVFAELAAIADPAQIPEVLAQALGIADDTSGDVGDTVVARLRNREMLLVLDNLEHLTPGAAWIAQLLDACPKVQVLATSREPLRVRAEHLFNLKPLDAVDAAELFVARARAVQPDFSATESNRDALATIVARLEGLPLAIELAAPQLRLLPPKALAARLDRRLPMLEQGAIDLPERQQTMRGAIAWSYDLLSAGEQRFFRKLSELRGGGSLDAARAIATDDEASESVVLSRVAALVEKSLLTLEEDAEGEPRLTMLDMLREFASERLTDAERDETRSRHATYFLDFAERVKAELSRSGQERTLRRLERERANFVAALSYFDQNAAGERGLRLAFALSRFWWLRGRLTEGRTWLVRFLRSGDGAPEISQQLRARSLRALVVLMSALGQFDEALPPCEEAVSLQRQISDDEGLAASLNSLGIIMQFRDDMARSKAAHEESLAIRRRIGDEPGVASSLSNLSSIAFTHGDLSDAARFAEESVAIYRRLEHTSGMSHALAKLGLVAAARKEYEVSERIFEEALALQRRLGNDGAAFYALSNLGMVAYKRGNFDVALRRQREALELLEVVPNKAAMAATLEGLAAALNATGDSRRAARILGAATALRGAIGAPLLPRDRADYDETMSAARNALGSAEFEAEWRVGTLMSLQRALDETADRTKV
jgi:predicted ATPase/DNA-binding XRE family transcriptional regulator